MPMINGLNTEKLLDIVEAVKQNRETGKTVRTASAGWLEEFKEETESRGFKLKADEPELLAGTCAPREMTPL